MKKNKKKAIPYGQLTEKIAVLWTRVSSERQEKENCSLDTQREVCERYASSNGIRIKRYFGGQHESGKSEGELYKQMVAFALSDKEVNVILVYSFDRFSRSAEAIVTKQKLKENGVYVISATQASDPDSATGDFVENLSLILGKFDNAIRTDKILSGQQGQLERGNWPFQIPIGYSRHKEGHDMRIVVNEEGKILRNAFIWRANGEREVDIVGKLEALGLHIDRKHLNKVLKNKFYCGVIEHPRLPDGPIKGNHEPLIDEETFNRANGISHTGYAQAEITDDFPLKRHVYCDDCGGALTGYTRKRKAHTHHYYKCNRKGCRFNINALELHDSYTELLTSYEVNEELLSIVRDMVNNDIANYYGHKKENESLLKKRKTELQHKIDDVEYKFALGEIPTSAYQVAMKRLKEEVAGIDQQLDEAVETLSNTQKMADYAVKMSCELGNLWREADFRSRQKLQTLIFPKGVRYDKKNRVYRAPQVNEVVFVNSRKSTSCGDCEIKNGDSDDPESPYVEKTANLSNRFFIDLRMMIDFARSNSELLIRVIGYPYIG